MSRTVWAGIAVVAVAAGVLGWMAGAEWRESPPVVASGPVTDPLIPAAITATPQSVTVLADGTVSIRVERAPVVWLLQELERQGARVPQAAPDSPIDAMPRASDVSDAPGLDAEGQQRLVTALRAGTETERQAALVRASEQGVDLPIDLLRQVVVSDSSESVRLLAFNAYLDAVSGDMEAVREVLQAGLANSAMAVQADARRRTSELEQLEQVVAATPPQGTQ